MTTKSNEEATGKKITKKDLMSLFFRSFLLPACYSMDRMQAPGFAYSMIPVLKKLYGDNKEKFSQALSRHSEVYNNTFACSPFVLGIAAAMEEEAAANEEFDVSSINAIKVASNMLPALGFALLMQLTYNRELAPFLFVGFVIVAFLGMSNVGVAIIGAILAVLIFNFSDRGNKEVSVDVDEI